ncbi:Uu.00g109960.m01.CDS01 [Anthostomella pinea]|uniref:Uu.00g109960.m01.CDS01 n=1 Tax=Anthostomella pinea TaxID=933095 RepID=A0AAI8VET9_9PEZI|nr:Uu.00g109960.m01.CDS01 [Anthostomella pinea]
MHSMQRSFGQMLHKSPGDNAKVAVMLSDYEDADKLLAKIIEQAGSWRESWVSIAMAQLGIITEFDSLWDPIVGASDGNARNAAPTPGLQLEQTLRLKEAYAELKNELMEEVKLIDTKIIRPADEARDCIAPLRKTIKKRENKRLDYEKCQDKANKLQRKPGRSAKDDATLAKADAEVERTAEDFHAADTHLRETLPPIVAATFSMIPPLISAVVVIQNRLLGLYYTTLHNYCQDYNFPSPAPPMEEVIAAWSAGYDPVKREFESVSCIASGKAVRQPMKLPDDPSNQDQERRLSNSSEASSTVANGFRRVPSGLISSNAPAITGPRPSRMPSSTSLASQASAGLQKKPSFGSNYHLAPTDFTTASRLGQSLTPTAVSPNSQRPRTDYFARPSTASTTASSASVNTAASLASIAVKKKAPPPPPPKRIGSTRPEEFVVAQYDFTGQGAGDLSFREGDRIKIVKKTGTDQDWWMGELGGRKGSFPANYCKAA